MPSYPGSRDFPTYRICECMNANEYQGLTDAKKDYVRMILSCGTIRFSVGAPLRSVIMDVIFPEGTTTHNNILNMLEWEFPQT